MDGEVYGLHFLTIMIDAVDLGTSVLCGPMFSYGVLFFLQYSLCSPVVLFSDTFHFYTMTDNITYTYVSFI